MEQTHTSSRPLVELHDKMEKAEHQGTTSKSERRVSTTRYIKLNRLPTLQEVLDRRTRAPLDLFCFYVGHITGVHFSETDDQIFLQRESAEDALDFWLDVQQHENMCKAYLKVTHCFAWWSDLTIRTCVNPVEVYRKIGPSMPNTRELMARTFNNSSTCRPPLIRPTSTRYTRMGMVTRREDHPISCHQLPTDHPLYPLRRLKCPQGSEGTPSHEASTILARMEGNLNETDPVLRPPLAAG